MSNNEFSPFEENKITGVETPEVFPLAVKRCPVVIILDTSSSMTNNNKIKELNDGVRILKEALDEDETASSSVDIAIIEMGGQKATLSQEFIQLEDWKANHDYQANGITPMKEAIEIAIEQIQKRKEIYDKEGVSYYRPLLMILSDGVPTDKNGRFDSNWKEFSDKLNDLKSNKKVVSYTFFIGQENDIEAKEIMKELASVVDGSVLSYKLTQKETIKNIFLWLSSSIKIIVSNKNDDSLEAKLF